MSRRIEKEVVVGAPPDRVWRALTEADELTRWFPVDARVEPGPVGSIWLSWGGGSEAQAPITAWEPARRLQWTESRGPIQLAVDFHVRARAGGTVVRLVQSGFGDGPDWDDEFHMTEGGWSYFLQHLRWYLERHRDVRRDLISFREAVPLSRIEAFSRLLGPAGLSAEGTLASAAAGQTYSDVTGQGDHISGTVVADSPATGQLGFTVAELGDAIVFIEMEPHASGARAGFWLSTYGLDASALAQARERFGHLYRAAYPELSAPKPAEAGPSI